MRALLKFAVLIAGLAFSSSAMAQTAANGTVEITATVTAACSIDAGAGATTTAGLMDTADFSNGGASLILTGAHVNATLATGDCNTATHIRLTSLNGAAKLTGATTPATVATYSNFFDYTAAVTFSGVSVTLDTSTDANFTAGETILSAAATSGPASGNIGITVTPVGTPKLQAGTHSDTLTIELTAN